MLLLIIIEAVIEAVDNASRNLFKLTKQKNDMCRLSVQNVTDGNESVRSNRYSGNRGDEYKIHPILIALLLVSVREIDKVTSE